VTGGSPSAARRVNAAPTPSLLAMLRERWPDWVGYAAAAWSLAYPEDSGLGERNWGTTAPGLLWPLWGAALAAALLANHLRRRGRCARCGRA
jgi:hypothetical protein